MKNPQASFRQGPPQRFHSFEWKITSTLGIPISYRYKF